MKQIKFYVAPNGNDNNNGSITSPFATPEKAVEAVRGALKGAEKAPVTVYFHGGEYKTKGLVFSAEDSGSEEMPVTYKSFGDGEVLFNGGTTLKNADFKPVTDEKVLSRLDEKVRDKVKVIDLKPYGITLSDIGPIYPAGTGISPDKYDGDVVGNCCEIFWNDKRLTTARYPNDRYSYIQSVTDRGENPNSIDREIWKGIRNPRGGTIVVDDEAKAHIAKWQEPEKAWAFGRFYWEWADMSTPVTKADAKTGEVSFKYTSSFDYREGGSFYFFNVLEELDEEGEYYIDRDNMLVYVYPPQDELDCEASISVTDKPIISAKDANYLTFEGITFKGTRANISELYDCNYLTVKNCKFTSAFCWAMRATGKHITVYGCEMCNLGRGGVHIWGGDMATFEPGDCIVENCYIHHFEQIYRTYQQGVFMNGCKNKVIHNEICYAPHLAVSYYGVDNLIAYNYIHDVVIESSDSGALYVGGSWTSPGNEINFNLFENIGADDYTPSAIYFDDGMSGQSCFGNIIINCKGSAFLFGGGREIIAKNNLTINVPHSIFYDDRFSFNGYDPIINHAPGTGLWTTLDRVPYKGEAWAKRFPLLAKITLDFADYKSKDFPANPSYSVIQHNVQVGDAFNVAQSENIHLFSDIIDNYACPKNCISDDGKFTLSDEFIKENNLPWVQIPVDEIGRYKE